MRDRTRRWRTQRLRAQGGTPSSSASAQGHPPRERMRIPVARAGFDVAEQVRDRGLRVAVRPAK
jgi:hypothetical protein